MRRYLPVALVGLLIGTLVFATDYKALIGTEDVNFGTGTFTRKTSTGSTITLNKIDSSKVPLKSASGYYVDGLFDGGYGLTIYPTNITGDNTGRVQGMSIGAAAGTDNGYFDNTATKTLYVSGIPTFVGAPVFTDNTLNGADLIDGSVPNGKFTDNNINGTKVLDNSILSSKIQFRGALVYKSDSQSITTDSQKITWNNELYDTSSIHAVSGSDNTKLIVPSGASYVKVQAQVSANSDNSVVYAYIYKNNALLAGGGYVVHNEENAVTTTVHLSTPVVSVSASDYFEVVIVKVGGIEQSILQGTSQTWFALEVIQ